MRVIINGLLALRQRTGIGSYVANLAEGLQRLAGGDAVVAFPTGAMRSIARVVVRTLGERGVNPARVRSRRFGLPKPLLAYSREFARRVCHGGFRLACASGRFDLYHEPNYLPWPSNLPTIVTIHDLSALRHPEWHPSGRVAMFEKHFLPRLRHCRHVLTDSESIRSEAIREMGLPPERVTAVPLGVRPELRPLRADECGPILKRLGLPSDYLLHVGTIVPRKILLALLRAYCALPGSVREKCPLVLVGGWGWNHDETAAYLHDTARHHNVIHAGYVHDRDLAAVYSAARALVFPTFYEGFGLPPLEMMACGGAVIASTAAAVREVVRDRACLLDPRDGDGWRDAMLRVIRDDDWRNELRRGTEARAARFTWEQCARATRDVYRLAVGGLQARRAA